MTAASTEATTGRGYDVNRGLFRFQIDATLGAKPQAVL
ncbi:MAG: hypothetical protein RL710_2915 [Pseudomonadota bacterium]|jgi:hypothetical protein